METFNRMLTSILATMAADWSFDWEEHLQPACVAYNASVHPTTGCSPFFLMHGRQARMLIDRTYGSPNSRPLIVIEYTSELHETLEAAYDHVWRRMERVLDRQKEIYDQNIHGWPFQCKDLVWLHCPVVPRGHSRKLHRPWQGPYCIVKKLSENTFRIQHSTRRGQKKFVIYFDRLKLCSPHIHLPEKRNQ